MQPMEKNVEKQLVVRTFEPDMNALKQTAKQLAHMQDTSLNLYAINFVIAEKFIRNFIIFE